MKKITKLFSVFATLLTVFGTLVNLVPVAHAATQDTKVIVHKIVMNEDDFNNFTYTEDFTKYNGNAISNDAYSTYFGASATEVAGVNFKVWQKVSAAATGTKTGADLGISGDTDNYQLVPSYTNGVTTTDAGAAFTLPEGTYIFVEDKENSPYYNQDKELTGMKAVPFKLELPQAKVDGTGYFNTTDALNVYPKNTEDKPEIEKTFADGSKNQKPVNIGDLIEYKITTTAPKDAAYKTFAWEDTMVNGLDFNTGSLVISLAGANLTKDNDYSLVETKRGFTVKLTDAGLAKLETAAKAGDVNFTLTYNATLNDSAAVDTGIPNKVKLIYGNRPSDFSEPKSTKPSNGEITVNKTWGDGVTKKDVVFGVYEKETGVRVGEITLQAGASTGKLGNLDNSKEYIVIEETSVSGSLPNYSNGTTGTINVENKKNPNPNPLEPEEPEVITYGKRFVKTDDNVDKSAAAKLVGAKFVVQKDGQFLALKDAATQATEIAAYQNAEDAYVAAVKAENPNQDDINAKKATRDAAYEAMNMQWTWVSNQSEAFTFVSSTDGKFEVKGLNAGTYQLVETKAPDGYALLTSPIEFQVGLGTWTDNSETAIDGHTRVNNKKVTIPQTGGIGTLVFTVVGLSVMVFAFIAMKKRQSEEA
ncbi:isopeptide-forming domain-containing fimbrial protein [Streptococcus suis]|uniref:Cell wall surface anchor family protein n=1 Tax=Streptococcus suis TaxID=1307 RepID=A0A0Z8R235_STRSU|nr:isopeptide-forming domain-containing fimbrial protein [Streptococcus suis]NQG30160.1 isopeptide-forming domain-containing fimbrial protein [Streptococcus suis]CYW74595.1 cell wall surface anchor family protein [Streptococcus suis]